MSTIPDHAVLLCAGLGSRLLPLTADRPKCLVSVGGRTILEHQVDALRAAGVGRITVVGGYRFDRLEAFAADRWSRGDRPELVFNPFYRSTSSIGSVWAARDRLRGSFCILNGDTIHDPALLGAGLARLAPGVNLFVQPVAVPAADDMLVRVIGDRAVAVGKTLEPAMAHHRSLGIVANAGPGDGGYPDALAATIAELDGPQRFHHAVADRLARGGALAVLPIAGVWTEIDSPDDIAGWVGADADIAAEDRALRFGAR